MGVRSQQIENAAWSLSTRATRGLAARASMAVLGLGILFSTGCMTSPTHLQLLGQKSEAFNASGFVLNAGDTVEVQYFNYSTGTWTTLATATSGMTPLNWSDEQWYYWTAGNVIIPENGWVYATEFTNTARLRARSGSSSLVTFDQDFWSCWDVDKSAGELWQDCGHSTELTIQALH